MEDLNPDGMRLLVERMVALAALDWKNAMRVLKNKPDSLSANRCKKDCERFFRSTYFYDLTHLNGRLILEKLQKEFEP